MLESRAREAGRSSGGTVSTYEGLDHPIDPVQWMYMQFGLFSVPTNGQQLVHQRLWCVVSCLLESTYKRSLVTYRKA